MPHSLHFVGIDLGAESGRVMLAESDGDRVQLEQVHRFANQPVALPIGDQGQTSLRWDVLRLWADIKQGIGLAARLGAQDLAGIGIDTWGVDFALLDRDGELVCNPYHYRDGRTDGMLDRAYGRLPRDQIFEQTGIQFMQFNTLYQLLAMVERRSPALQSAQTLLTMPDLFNYWLSGRKVCEFTMATTTQCLDPRQREWSKPLLQAMGIPIHLFPPIVQPGTILGDLRPAIADEVGCGCVPVIAPGTHDTASAVAAVPAAGKDFAWISSGTWSIMGAETSQPVINAQSLKYNFTNEGGVGGTWRFSKNIMGLWLVQECRRTWAHAGQDLSYAEMAARAEQAEPFRSIVNPDDDSFFKAGDIPVRIQEYCRRTGQPVPDSEGAILRCVFESLACRSRWVLEKLEEMLGRRLEPIHIVGGGSQNRLLNQLTADATNRTVVAGPVEAAALGNTLMQAIAIGQFDSLDQVRAAVRNSLKPESFAPRASQEWDTAYAKLCRLLEA